MSKTLIASVLAFIVASGGTFGGYKVIQEFKKFGADFETRPHMVQSVIDGDTIRIEKRIKVRLLGIDTPEKGECYYTESKEYLTELVDDKNVLLEKELSGMDRYGRLLRYIIVENPNPEEDNILVNNKMVLEGYAFTNPISPDKKYRDLLATSQRKAKAEEKGLWGSACDYSQRDKDAKTLREKASKPPSKECTIKGNISEKGYGKLYFLEGCPNYGRVKVDTRKGESWFCTETEAKKAGFSKSESCDNTF
ncbi:thermonuclease family protein [Candidatus Kaiserbacteria bacterium]|nr:MAG: thermonuclease family protein [Candidatus Kaiserbacteria bacterium]